MGFRGACRVLATLVAFGAPSSEAASGGFRAQLPQALVQEEGSSTALFRDALALVEHKVYNALVRKAGYPLPVVHHDKDPASGYNQGSPLYEEQQRWVERNGDNSIPGAGELAWVPLPWRSVWEQFYFHPVQSVCGLIFQILIVVCFAYLYLQYMPTWRKNHRDLAYHQSNEAASFRDWRHTPWDINCAQDWQLCAWGWCCPIIRWADNIGHESVLKGSFWTAFFLMLILNILAPITFGISLVFALCIAIYFRQKMRRIFDLRPGEPMIVMYDVFLWCCCPCCALVQEARQVEKQSAIQAFHEAEARQQQFP